MNSYGKNLLLGLTIVTLTGCAASVTQSVKLPQQIDRNIDAVMVVIDDPRSNRRKQGFGVGYTARLSYADDPALHRWAAKIAGDYDLNILSEWPLRNLGVHCFVVRRPDQTTLAALESDPRVKWVQPFNEFSVETATPKPTSAPAPSIARRFLKEVTERGTNVTVAVIDTGADTTHPDLADSQVRYQNFVNTHGNGHDEPHGTAVVGLIAAKPLQSEQVVGLASSSDVHLLRACWQDQRAQGRCNTLTLALALDAAIDLQPDVLNLSLTGPYDRVLAELTDHLIRQGTLVVAAYDDSRPMDQRFPRPREGVIYAYGVERQGELHNPQSATSADILLAPWHAISLQPSANYGLVSGHSVATPHVSAMAACLIHRHPQATRHEIVSRLQQWLGQQYIAGQKLNGAQSAG